MAKNRVEQTQRNIQKQRKRELDEEERRILGPQNEEARRKLEDLRHETDSRFQMMNSSFEKLIMTLTMQKPQDNGMVAMMPMLVEMMKSSTRTNDCADYGHDVCGITKRRNGAVFTNAKQFSRKNAFGGDELRDQLGRQE